MSKLQIVKFLRISFVSSIILFVLFEFSNCGGGEAGENDSSKGRGDDYSSDRPNRGTLDDDYSEDALGSSDEHPFGNDDEGEAIVPLQILDQNDISNKIDFIFVIDSSKSNIRNLVSPKIENQLGGLPDLLNSRNIDWQMYFLNSEYDSEKHLRNGSLLELEHNGAIIRASYLNSADVNVSYQAPTREVFIDTIEHNVLQRSLSHCSYPPYCFEQAHNRPLSALNTFIGRSQNTLREGADVVVVILTNTDEVPVIKRGGFLIRKIKSKTRTTAPQVIDNFKTLFPQKKIYAVSIVVKDQACVATNGGKSSSYISSYVPQLSIATKGIVLSICPDEGQMNAYSIPIIELISGLQDYSYS